MVGKWLSDLIMPEVKSKRIANAGFPDVDVEDNVIIIGKIISVTEKVTET